MSAPFLAPTADGLRNRLLALRAIALFETVDDEGLLLLAEHARPVRYRAGDVLAVDGEIPRAIQILTAGEVTRQRAGQLPQVAGVGQALGALHLIARAPGPGVVARGEVRTLEIPAAAFEAALDASFSLLRGLLRFTGSSVLAARSRLPVDPRATSAVDEGPYYEGSKSLVVRLMELRSGPFTHMNLDALVDLARRMIEIRVEAGTCLWSIGDPSTHALHIDHGRVRCSTDDGRSADVGRGYTLGVMDVWGGHERAYEARAATRLIAYRVDFEAFLLLLEMHVEVALEMLRALVRGRLASGAPD